MIQPPNPILAALAEKRARRDATMFQRLLWTGPLTARLDKIAALLNRA